MNVIIVGGTGSVGRLILDMLSARQDLQLSVAASCKSAGTTIACGNTALPVHDISQIDFSNFDYAFFAVNRSISAQYTAAAQNSNCTIIDISSMWRMHSDVPLIVPEINLHAIPLLQKGKSIIISNPNCIAIPLASVLAPLHKQNPVKSVVVSTYQAVSGAGRAGITELKQQIADPNAQNHIIKRKIAFNAVPQIGEIIDNGITDEEDKVVRETQKILESSIDITATCVRVPVVNCHSISATIEFDTSIQAMDAKQILSQHPHIKVLWQDECFATALDTDGETAIHVSRIRNSTHNAKQLSLWITCDNLLKGAALNAVQIFNSFSDKLSSSDLSA